MRDVRRQAMPTYTEVLHEALRLTLEERLSLAAEILSHSYRLTGGLHPFG